MTTWSRSLIAVLVVVLAVSASSHVAPAAEAQGACEFRLGFKALRDQIPGTVGECVDNEAHNPENGDSIQPTTRGLMAWRKADNWTAFTDGSTTWINGPDGLQSRPNSERFPWEAVAAPVVAPSAPAPAIPVVDTAPEPVAAPVATAVPTPTPPTGGPITKPPTEAILSLNDVGKEINQIFSRTGEDGRSKSAESKFERAPGAFGKKLGPQDVYSKVYIANNVDAAKAIYAEESNKQGDMPEADEKLGVGRYPNEGANAVNKVGDEMASHAACNDNCATELFVSLHQRSVMRHQNAVVVLYFWGKRDTATPTQVNEWMGLIRARL